jgi:hypothetical protein
MKTAPTPKLRKLSLARETVRKLNAAELALVAGGLNSSNPYSCRTVC